MFGSHSVSGKILFLKDYKFFDIRKRSFQTLLTLVNGVLFLDNFQLSINLRDWKSGLDFDIKPFNQWYDYGHSHLGQQLLQRIPCKCWEWNINQHQIQQFLSIIPWKTTYVFETHEEKHHSTSTKTTIIRNYRKTVPVYGLNNETPSFALLERVVESWSSKRLDYCLWVNGRFDAINQPNGFQNCLASLVPF